jgi:hypothetical protein
MWSTIIKPLSFQVFTIVVVLNDDCHLGFYTCSKLYSFQHVGGTYSPHLPVPKFVPSLQYTSVPILTITSVHICTNLYHTSVHICTNSYHHLSTHLYQFVPSLQYTFVPIQAPWQWSQYNRLRCQYEQSLIHGVETQKMAIIWTDTPLL